MIFLLGMLGLGIDLASLYVGRTQAQRSADAAALAGAQAFVDSGYTSGLVSAATAQSIATDRALTVGNANLIAGASPSMSAGDLTFNFSNPEDPQITAVAARDTNHGNPMPTFFVKIFGVESANVSASATAEAFNPSGTGVGVASACVKPWLLPNCDPSWTLNQSTPPANTNCPAVDASGNVIPGSYYGYFIDPTTGAIERPGAAPAGAIGEFIAQLKPGSPGSALVPSKFMPVCIPPGTTPAICPSCGKTVNGGGTNSGALYAMNIACCNQNLIVCGSNTVQPVNGDMVGPTKSGVDCLINEGGGGTGQDILNTNSTPFTVTAGSNNPFFPSGSTISIGDSSSTVTVPIYDGTILCPGGSCPSTLTVNVIGFLQMFVKAETNPQATVQAYVLNISGCGSGGSGGTGGSGTVSAAGSPVPVRLIYP